MKRRISLKTGLLSIIVSCWLMPIFIVVVLSAVLFGSSYRQTVYDEMNTSMDSAMRQVQLQLEVAIADSKAVSYDGDIQEAYRTYLADRDRADLYRRTNEYLSQSFFMKSQYQAVSIHYWDAETNVNSYYFTSGTAGYELLNQCRENVPAILSAMADADTKILFLPMGDRLCMARNLVDVNFNPYATIVMMLDLDVLLRPMAAITRSEAMRISMDDAVLFLEDDAVHLADRPLWEGDLSYRAQADGHSLLVETRVRQYDLWDENPWLFWSVLSVAMLVLPLLTVMISLFYRHITRPMETLVEANSQVEAGQRGYAIPQAAPNAEFAMLYSHFNTMSEELKRQFEQSYLEQQATQKARMKALQSQINPHFLNNSLEIINWEARLAGNERISAMIEALSTMLGAALDRDDRTQIPLSEELGYVDAYLYIIRERLGGNLTVTRDMDSAMEQVMIPRLILQPIVENAVEHDIVNNRGGTLTLRAYTNEGNVVLEVEHNGTMSQADREAIARLLSPESAEKGQVGLRNVYQRLRLLYRDAGSLTLEEVSQGTILARICFPIALPGNANGTKMDKKSQGEHL